MCVHWKDGKNLGEKRLSEHKTAVTKHKTKNGIAVHSWANKHQVNWATVKQEERGYWKRRVLEALHIHQQPRASNLDCGLTINPSWLPLLESLPLLQSPPDYLTHLQPQQHLPPLSLNSSHLNFTPYIIPLFSIRYLPPLHHSTLHNFLPSSRHSLTHPPLFNESLLLQVL